MRYITATILILSVAGFSWGQGTRTGGTGAGAGGGGLDANAFADPGGDILSDAGNSTVEGSGFLGRNSAESGFLSGGRNDTGRNTFGNAGGFGGRTGGFGGGNNRGNGQVRSQSSTRVIRTRITIPRDFQRVVIPQSRIRSRLHHEFSRVTRLGVRTIGSSRISSTGLRNSNVSASVSGRTVTLTGVVSSERDRVIAEKMAKMEPGVDAVSNQLVIAQ